MYNILLIKGATMFDTNYLEPLDNVEFTVMHQLSMYAKKEEEFLASSIYDVKNGLWLVSRDVTSYYYSRAFLKGSTIYSETLEALKKVENFEELASGYTNELLETKFKAH